MRKLIISIVFLVSVVLIVVYFLAGLFLTQLTEQGILLIKQNAGKYGYQVHDISFKSAGLSFLTSAEWKDISLDIELTRGDRNAKSYRARAEIGDITLSLSDFGKRLVGIKASRMKAYRIVDKRVSAEINQTIVKISEFATKVRIDFLSIPTINSDIEAIMENIRRLITDGRTINPIEFKGNCLFGINGKPVTARISSEKRGGEYVVIMNADDLRSIAQTLEEDVNEPEVQLLAKNPLRAPRLLKIRNKARSKAEEAYSINKNISEDAYRHVLWSYLLTLQYGERFAKLVTDAHEQGDYEDSDADHKMDYHNNEIGRQYARAGIPENQVLQKASTDSRVVGFVS